MKKMIIYIIVIIVCPLAFGQSTMESILNDAFKKEKYHSSGRDDCYPFSEFLFMMNADSISQKFKYSLENDTVFIVGKWIYEGGLGYFVWNKTDTISRFYPQKNINRDISIYRELLILIEEWDTCKLKNIHRREGRIGGEHIMYTSRIIMKNGNYVIESIEHEYWDQ